MNGGKKRREQLRRMYIEQNGRCYWCKVEMLPPGSHTERRVRPPENLCTFNYRYDRFSDERGKYPNSRYRHNVAACWQCSFEIGRAAQAAQPLEELHARSKHKSMEVVAGRVPCPASVRLCLTTSPDHAIRSVSRVFSPQQRTDGSTIEGKNP